MSKTIKLTSKGSFKNSFKIVNTIKRRSYFDALKVYGERGVEALSRATPVDTGKTASSWGYEILEENGRLKIIWTNSNINHYVPIAIIIQYGHATRNGGWVEGIDYINPALKPVFEQIRDNVWREVTR